MFGDWDETFATCDLCVLLSEHKPWRCFLVGNFFLGEEKSIAETKTMVRINGSKKPR